MHPIAYLFPCSPPAVAAGVAPGPVFCGLLGAAAVLGTAPFGGDFGFTFSGFGAILGLFWAGAAAAFLGLPATCGAFSCCWGLTSTGTVLGGDERALPTFDGDTDFCV